MTDIDTIWDVKYSLSKNDTSSLADNSFYYNSLLKIYRFMIAAPKLCDESCKTLDNIKSGLDAAKNKLAFDETVLINLKDHSKNPFVDIKSLEFQTKEYKKDMISTLIAAEKMKGEAKTQDLTNSSRTMTNVTQRTPDITKNDKRKNLFEKLEYHLEALLLHFDGLILSISDLVMCVYKYSRSAERSTKYKSRFGIIVTTQATAMINKTLELILYFKIIQAQAINIALQFHYIFFYLPSSFFQL